MPVALLLAAAVALAAPLPAQADTTAGIRGTALSAFNGQPLSDVTITVAKVHKSVTTLATGAFELGGLPYGTQKMRVSYHGKDTDEFEITLISGAPKELAVLLDTTETDLNPVVTEVQHPDVWRDLGGFYARRKVYGGFAHFYTRQEIERSRAGRLSILLTQERIVTRCNAGCRPTRYIGNRICIVPVSVDGLPLTEGDYDLIAVKDVAAVEVYRGTPPYGLAQGMSLSAAGSVWQGESLNGKGTCGSVLIWMR